MRFLSSPRPYTGTWAHLSGGGGSNGNNIKTKANESLDNGFFFDIEAKRKPLIVSKLFLKRSHHIE
jgi:hypothetical protein